MSGLRRVQPLDLAIGAVVVTAAVFALVKIPGYRWAGQAEGAFLRAVPVTVTIEVPNPVQARIAQEWAPGVHEFESGQGRLPARLEAIEPLDGGGARLRLTMTARVDGSGRAYWGDTRLRRGEGLTLADAARRASGLQVDIAGLDAGTRR